MNVMGTAGYCRSDGRFLLRDKRFIIAQEAVTFENSKDSVPMLLCRSRELCCSRMIDKGIYRRVNFV